MKIIKKIKTLSTWANDAIKLFFIITSTYGFGFLLSYTHGNGIPFPLDLSVLPSLLILYGAVSIFFVTAIISTILFPFFLSEKLNKYSNNFFIIKNGKIRKRSSSIRTYIGAYLIPNFTIYFSIINIIGHIIGPKEQYMSLQMSILCIFGSFIWIFVSTFFFKLKPIQPPIINPTLFEEYNPQINYLGIATLKIVSSIFPITLLILLVELIFPEIRKLEYYICIIYAFFVYSMTGSFTIIPTWNQDTPSPSSYFEKSNTFLFKFILFLSLALPLILIVATPFGEKLSSAALRLYNIGGRIPAVICLKKKPKGFDLAKSGFNDSEINIHFNKNFCSEPVNISLKIGNEIYISKITNTNKIDNNNKNKANNTNKPENDWPHKIPAAKAILFLKNDIEQIVYLPTSQSKKSDTQDMKSSKQN